MFIRMIGTTAYVLYCGVVIVVCGTFLKKWYDQYYFDIWNAVDIIRMKIGH